VSSFVSDEGPWVILTPSTYKTHPARAANPTGEQVREAVFNGKTNHPYRDDNGICWQCRWGATCHIKHPVTHFGCDNCGKWFYRDYVFIQPVEVLLPAETFNTPSGPFRLEAHWVERVMFFCGPLCCRDRLDRVPFDLEFQS